MNKIITILIADDHPLFRKGLREIIEDDPDMHIIMETGDGNSALRFLEERNPDIAILDIEMPGMSGLDIAAAIQRQQLPVAIIILTMHDKEIFFNDAMDAGASGYVLKNCAVTDILDCIRSVYAGKSYISPIIATHLMKRGKQSSNKNMSKHGLPSLTETERSVMKHVVEGKSTKEIAEHLFVTAKTIETHRHNICSKLNIHGTNSLLRFALEHKDEL